MKINFYFFFQLLKSDLVLNWQKSAISHHRWKNIFTSTNTHYFRLLTSDNSLNASDTSAAVKGLNPECLGVWSKTKVRHEHKRNILLQALTRLHRMSTMILPFTRGMTLLNAKMIICPTDHNNRSNRFRIIHHTWVKKSNGYRIIHHTWVKIYLVLKYCSSGTRCNFIHSKVYL